jgi:hypothetical protein
LCGKQTWLVLPLLLHGNCWWVLLLHGTYACWLVWLLLLLQGRLGCHLLLLTAATIHLAAPVDPQTGCCSPGH